ncbi:hypothetical protein O3M35_010838 [Rhynocoris fuscipes]|uniref:Uncharacterized protein n=1 Tax=Rhynocoris fuscipes TaxID=488301 RepID=A0AAW1D6K2_9HEMI
MWRRLAVKSEKNTMNVFEEVYRGMFADVRQPLSELYRTLAEYLEKAELIPTDLPLAVPSNDDLDMPKYEWIRNPFVIEKYDDFGVTTAEHEMIIGLSSDSTLKQMFRDENNIVTFWLRVKNDFPTLTNKALEILLPFVTSYLSETGYSTVAVLKIKYRSRLVIEKELRTSITSMISRFEKICAEKQAQPSH